MFSRPVSRRVLIAACALVVSLVATGCGDNTSGGSSAGTSAPAGTDATPKSAGAGGKKLRLAFVSNNSADFWTIARKGTEKAVKEMPNVTVEFQMPQESGAAAQKRIVDDLLAKGIDGMAISPVDPKNQTEMLNGIAKQAVLVTQDSDAPDSNRVCYIGTDNIAAGRQAGELVKKALPSGGKIMLFVGTLDAKNAQERRQGLLEAIKGANIAIIDTRTDDTDRTKAKQNVADTLVKYPEVGCLVGLWAYNGPAIVSAVRDANKIGKVKIVCFDEESDTLAGVKDGAVEGTVVQNPFEFGYQSIVHMAQYAGGDKSVFPADKKIIVPTRIISKENVDEFAAKLKELRGK